MKTNRSRIRTLVPQCAAILAVAAAVLFAGAAAHGALLAEELFDYDIGTLQDKNGGTGWAGAWGKLDTANEPGDVTSPGMTHPSLIDTGTNKASINASSSASARPERNFGSDIGADGVWISFIAQTDDNVGGNDERRSAGLDFVDDSGGKIVSVGRTNSTGSGSGGYENWVIGDGLSNESTTTVATDDDGDPLGTHMKTLVVLNFSQSGIDMFLNPDNTGVDSATHTATFTTSIGAGTDLGKISFFVGDASGRFGSAGPAELDFDDLRVGESFSDVVIPEPASALLLALGCVAALLRRPRRRK